MIKAAGGGGGRGLGRTSEQERRAHEEELGGPHHGKSVITSGSAILDYTTITANEEGGGGSFSPTMHACFSLHEWWCRQIECVRVCSFPSLPPFTPDSDIIKAVCCFILASEKAPVSAHLARVCSPPPPPRNIEAFHPIITCAVFRDLLASRARCLPPTIATFQGEGASLSCASPWVDAISNCLEMIVEGGERLALRCRRRRRRRAHAALLSVCVCH